ncbi:MAG: hypothetical protein C0620_02925 [Desulfuromonas sp.]|jgi:hypothetical protein|nr:MAG: hypothetical protein C0620_02925 [Desulfuromonas sp.]
MLTTRDQQAVFLLAHVVIRDRHLTVAALKSGQDIHHRTSGRPAMLDWAMDYVLTLPDSLDDQELLHNLHLNPSFQWTPEQTRRAATVHKSFYQRLQKDRIYAIGLNWLNSQGRNILERFALSQHNL